MSSHSLSPVTKKDSAAIAAAPAFKLPANLTYTLYVLMAVGALSFVWGLLQEDPTHAWLSFLVTFCFWFGMSAAQTLWGAILHISNGQWGRPIRRLFESGSIFFKYGWLGLVVLFFGREYIYQWASPDYYVKGIGKDLWLSTEFFFGRELLIIAGMGFLGALITKLSVGKDVAAGAELVGASDEVASRWKREAEGKFRLGFSGDALARIKAANQRMWRLSPIMIAAYALGMSFVAWDLIMSVDYHWYSTLFGALYFISAIYIALAWCGMSIGIVREIHPLFKQKIHRRTLHDLGKLLFGFGIFWAYMFWSHYLPLWYSNMPEFTGWMVLRLREEPWHGFAWVVLGLCFFIPFLLGLSRDVKQMPILLFATGAIVMAGIWLQFYLLVFPQFYPDAVSLNLMDILLFFGMGALYALSQAKFLERVPLMPFGDFYDEDDRGAQMAA